MATFFGQRAGPIAHHIKISGNRCPFVCVVDASMATQMVSPEPLMAQATAPFVLLTDGQATFHALIGET